MTLTVPAKQNGFTLLELLVSLTLFSIISIGLYSGLSLAIKSISGGERHTKEVRHVIAIQRFLRNRLSNVQKKISKEHAGKMHFSGQQHSLEFISDMPQSIDQGGYVAYKIAALDKGINISLIPYPEHTEEDKETSFAEPVQIQDIQQIIFHYFGAKAGERKKNWHTQWLKQSSLPTLIKIELQTNSNTLWPAIIIAPQNAIIIRKVK